MNWFQANSAGQRSWLKMLSLAQYRLHSYTKRFHDRLDYSRQCIENALRVTGWSPRWLLSLSLGKDSLCLYFLLKEYMPDIQCVMIMSSESFIIHDYATVLTGLVDDYNLNLHIIQSDWASVSDDWQAARGKGDIRLINKWGQDNGYVGTFIGMRKEENPHKKRGLALRTVYGGHAGYYLHEMQDQKAYGLYHACPLAEWLLEDVGAYCWLKDIPLLETYHVKGLAARTTGSANGIAVNHGNLVGELKAVDLEAYNKLIKLFPYLAYKS